MTPKQDSPCTLLQKEVYVALPVTAPSAAGFLLTVLTEKPSHPVTSTSTTWQSPNLQQGGGGACQLAGIWFGAADEWRTHAVSETISPRTPWKPSAPAATAAAAMVFTLLGARGHSSATDPLNKTCRPSPSFQSERASPVSRKQDGCLDILINTPWKHRRAHRKERRGIVTDGISASSPLISRHHSSSVCLGHPIMHHWVHKASCCACEPPDGAPGLNWHQTGQRESPPLRRKTGHKLSTVISTGPSNIFIYLQFGTLPCISSSNDAE